MLNIIDERGYRTMLGSAVTTDFLYTIASDFDMVYLLNLLNVGYTEFAGFIGVELLTLNFDQLPEDFEMEDWANRISLTMRRAKGVVTLQEDFPSDEEISQL